MREIRAFLYDEAGATAIEYALMGVLIAVAIVTTLTSIGTKLSATFSEVSSALP